MAQVLSAIKMVVVPEYLPDDCLTGDEVLVLRGRLGTSCVSPKNPTHFRSAGSLL